VRKSARKNRYKTCFIYVFSFALHPEDVVPSGSCNMSRIDHVDLSLQLQEGLGKEQVTVIVFARNFNILRFREGLGGFCKASNWGAWRRGTLVTSSRRVCRTALSMGEESASGDAWYVAVGPHLKDRRSAPSLTGKMSENGQNSDVVGGVRTRPSVAPGAKAPESDRYRLGRSSVT
jgi:hypothetical protein